MKNNVHVMNETTAGDICLGGSGGVTGAISICGVRKPGGGVWAISPDLGVDTGFGPGSGDGAATAVLRELLTGFFMTPLVGAVLLKVLGGGVLLKALGGGVLLKLLGAIA